MSVTLTLSTKLLTLLHIFNLLYFTDFFFLLDLLENDVIAPSGITKLQISLYVQYVQCIVGGGGEVNSFHYCRYQCSRVKTRIRSDVFVKYN